MERKRLDLLLLCISVISFLLMSVMFLLMPIDNLVSTLKDSKITLIVGVGFWGFLIIGIVAQIILANRRKVWYRIQRLNEKRSSARRIGLLVFASNTPALIADIAALISIIGLVIAVILTHATGYVCYIFLATLSFSFCLHCILNGKVYYHITHHYDKKATHERNSAKDYKYVEGEQ